MALYRSPEKHLRAIVRSFHGHENEQAFKRGKSKLFLVGFHGLTQQQIAGSMIGDGQRIAVSFVAEAELAFCNRRTTGRSSASLKTVAFLLHAFGTFGPGHQTMAIQDGVNGAAGWAFTSCRNRRNRHSRILRAPQLGCRDRQSCRGGEGHPGARSHENSAATALPISWIDNRMIPDSSGSPKLTSASIVDNIYRHRVDSCHLIFHGFPLTAAWAAVVAASALQSRSSSKLGKEMRKNECSSRAAAKTGDRSRGAANNWTNRKHRHQRSGRI